jgi:hypothetical protein
MPLLEGEPGNGVDIYMIVCGLDETTKMFGGWIHTIAANFETILDVPLIHWHAIAR